MIKKDFLLKNDTGKRLYEKVAKEAPIYDYHNHLNVKEIYENKVFQGITQLWLGGDHYKWRLLRYAGVKESLVTGIISNEEAFLEWAKVLEKSVGTPLYHWAHMELQTYFDITEPLTEKNGLEIYKRCEAKIKENQIGPVSLLIKAGVKLLCTTDDPNDDLIYHQKIREEREYPFQVLPTFRPDSLLNVMKPGWQAAIEKLEQLVDCQIRAPKDLLEALEQRLIYFVKQGCKLSDHSMESLPMTVISHEEAVGIFDKARNGEVIDSDTNGKFVYYMIGELGKLYHQQGIAMQLHIGAKRNTNENRFFQLGPDTGYDMMNDFRISDSLIGLLNSMDKVNKLPKTILYSLNDKDNSVLAAIPPCFTQEGVRGKVQFGPAWWFNDHKTGIEAQLEALANQGLLPYSIGMLTDSRSFLSFVRHDYFRRILCNYLGEQAEEGLFFGDENILEEVLRGICYENVQTYLGV